MSSDLLCLEVQHEALRIHNEQQFHVGTRDCQSLKTAALLTNHRRVDSSFEPASGPIHAVAQYKVANELSDSGGSLQDVGVRKPTQVQVFFK